LLTRNVAAPARNEKARKKPRKKIRGNRGSGTPAGRHAHTPRLQ
jgi:hypothetical protein